MVARVGLQSGLAGAVQKYRQLDEILIGKTVRSVVGDRGSFRQIRGGERRRQGMQLEDEQTEPAHVRRPAAQVPHQIFFQLVARDFLSQMRECARGLSGSRPANIISGLQIRPVVIEKRADMKQVMHVMAECFEVARQQRRAVDIPVDHIMIRNSRLAQSLLGDRGGPLC